MKKTIGLLLCITLLFGLAGSTLAQSVSQYVYPEYKNVRIMYNGERIILVNSEYELQKSVIINNQVYVPIEAFIQAIGGSCTYDRSMNRLTIELGQAEPTPVIADITGSWHEISNSSITLTLNNDGTFVLKVIASSYHGNWSFDGYNLTLSQNNSDLTGTWSNSGLKLLIGGKYFSFVR